MAEREQGGELVTLDELMSGPGSVRVVTELVAACEGVSEPEGIECGGELTFRWGQIESVCGTCGGRCGIAVAAWQGVRTVEVVRPRDGEEG